MLSICKCWRLPLDVPRQILVCSLSILFMEGIYTICWSRSQLLVLWKNKKMPVAIQSLFLTRPLPLKRALCFVILPIAFSQWKRATTDNRQRDALSHSWNRRETLKLLIWLRLIPNYTFSDTFFHTIRWKWHCIPNAHPVSSLYPEDSLFIISAYQIRRQQLQAASVPCLILYFLVYKLRILSTEENQCLSELDKKRGGKSKWKAHFT